MNLDQLRRHRHYQQQLVAPRFGTPAEVVAWLGAVQAQDFTGAKWALAMRLKAGSAPVTEAAIDAAFNAGELLRTHAMRPTWHFVAPADLRWLQALTGPQVHKRNGPYYRQFGVDAAFYQRAAKVLAKELRDRQYKTRDELAAALDAAGLSQRGTGLALVIMWAELEALIVSGPRVGKQFTYALVEEVVPPAPALGRDEALAELVRRYFSSHGPAQATDFATWSGLSAADTRRGLALVGGALEQMTLDEKTYWFAPADPPPLPPDLYLLPNYDEATLAYKDRSAILPPEAALVATESVVRAYSHQLFSNGQVIGLWKRELGKVIEVTPLYFQPPTAAQRRELGKALQRYSAFAGVPVVAVDAAA